MYKDGRCLNKSDRNTKRLLTARQIVGSRTNHIVMKNCQLQDKSYRNAYRRACRFNAPGCQKSLSGQIRSYCKKLTASRTNRIVIHRHVLLASLRYCFIHRCLFKSDRIAKSLITNRTNYIVMHRYVPVVPMRRSVITCCLDKSDHNGIETCYVFHCAAVSSSVFSEQLF